MAHYKVCEICHIAFDKDMDKCPKCGREVHDGASKGVNSEGEGRKHHAGGEACNYCSHCYGNKDWCPYMD